MESAEAELRALQNTCRELIGRTTNGNSSSSSKIQETSKHRHTFLPPPSPVGSTLSEIVDGVTVDSRIDGDIDGGNGSSSGGSVSGGKVKKSPQRLVSV